MNIFKNKKFAIKATAPTFRHERIQDEKKPAPLPSKLKASKTQNLGSLSRASPSSPKSRSSTPSSDRLEPPSQKRKASRPKSPLRQQFDSDSDGEEESNAQPAGSSFKRQKVDGLVDVKRQIRSRQSFSDSNNNTFEMIHAADIAFTGKGPKTAVNLAPEHITVELQYPSNSQRERYIIPGKGDNIKPTVEIVDVAKLVTSFYLDGRQAEIFDDPNKGIIRQLERAKNLLSREPKNTERLEGFKKAVDVFNLAIGEYIKDGYLAQNLDSIHELPFDLVECILLQVYRRAVSPRVELLPVRNDEDNGEQKSLTYGELLPQFVSRILRESGLKSDHVFVDMGSGVGNVVLQAALEFGCESWGCEVRQNANMLAEAQQKEFSARCRLWGIKPGKARLECGDFLENENIKNALRKADVVLVNNEVFPDTLNQQLVYLFMDLKEGCRVVSLKNFVKGALSLRTCGDPAHLLEVVQWGEYSRNSVNWKDDGGEYFIAKKNEERRARVVRELELSEQNTTR